MKKILDETLEILNDFIVNVHRNCHKIESKFHLLFNCYDKELL